MTIVILGCLFWVEESGFCGYIGNRWHTANLWKALANSTAEWGPFRFSHPLLIGLMTFTKVVEPIRVGDLLIFYANIRLLSGI